MFVTIRGKRWNLRFVPNLGTDNGRCDSPDTPNKTIRIQQGLGSFDELETIIHEMLHAGQWDMSEEHTAGLAHDLASAMWRLGWRKADP